MSSRKRPGGSSDDKQKAITKFFKCLAKSQPESSSHIDQSSNAVESVETLSQPDSNSIEDQSVNSVKPLQAQLEAPSSSQDQQLENSSDLLQQTKAQSNSIHSYQSWIKTLGFDKSLEMNVFTLHANGGIVCLICSKYPSSGPNRGKNADVYTKIPGRPQRPAKLENHLNSDQHKKAVNTEKLQRSSTFHALHIDRKSNRLETVAQRILQIYWLLKEEVANRKVHSLQVLIDRIGCNERLKDFRHTSSTSVSEFIELISTYISGRIASEVRKSPCWASMVDETTDITSTQQYITFVQYLNSRGKKVTSFLDIRPIDERGGTAENLFATWKEVADDYDLDTTKHVALACDGAAAMLGCKKSLSKKILEMNPATYIVHCYAHRLALACTDTVKELKDIQDCERALVQTWKFFSVSTVKTAKLRKNQRMDSCSSLRKLIKACRTRWLSHGKAVEAMQKEITSVHTTLKYFATEKNDCTAIGLLQLITKKSFIFTLYILSEALTHLNVLSQLFQSGDFSFSHVSSAVSSCKAKISSISESDKVVSAIKKDWSKISQILPDGQELTLSDIDYVRAKCKCYCSALLANIDARFPEPEVLFAFRIFDALEIPEDVGNRREYGNEDLELLLNRFKITSGSGFDKVFNDYQTLKDRLISKEFNHCNNAYAVCSKIARDKVYEGMFPELHRLCCIALVIPLSTAWPERGFSTLCRIKTKQRNRLGKKTLNHLVNVSLNGPDELSDEDARAIADMWLKGKHRRVVGADTSVENNDDENDDEDDDNEAAFLLCDLDLNETEHFIL